jgi:hypothetical protein
VFQTYIVSVLFRYCKSRSGVAHVAMCGPTLALLTSDSESNSKRQKTGDPYQMQFSKKKNIKCHIDGRMTAFVNGLNLTLYKKVMDYFFGKRFGLNAMRAIQRREPNRLQINNTVSINRQNIVLWYQKRSTVPLYINSPSRQPTWL